MGKYLHIHICQIDSSATWTAFHFRLFTMPPGFLTGHINKFGLAVPVRKWFGVNASKSLMSSLRGVKDRPFKIDSISVKCVQCFLVKKMISLIVFQCFFVIFTIASMAPFIHGLTGGLKFQLIFWGVNSASILSWSKLFSDLASSLWAPAKLVPLSLKMFLDVLS